MSIYGIFERERISGNFWHPLLATFQIKKKKEKKSCLSVGLSTDLAEFAGSGGVKILEAP